MTKSSKIIESIDKRISELFFLKNGIQTYGVGKFSDKIIELGIKTETKPVSEILDLHINKIIDLVVYEYKKEIKWLKKEHIISIGRRGRITEAKRMVSVLIQENLKLSDIKTATFLGVVSRQVPFNYMSDYYKMCGEKKKHKDFFKKKSIIQSKYNFFNKF